jgi:hypothetical protein
MDVWYFGNSPAGDDTQRRFSVPLFEGLDSDPAQSSIDLIGRVGISAADATVGPRVR